MAPSIRMFLVFAVCVACLAASLPAASLYKFDLNIRESHLLDATNPSLPGVDFAHWETQFIQAVDFPTFFVTVVNPVTLGRPLPDAEILSLSIGSWGAAHLGESERFLSLTMVSASMGEFHLSGHGCCAITGPGVWEVGAHLTAGPYEGSFGGPLLITEIPETSTWALMLLGAVVLTACQPWPEQKISAVTDVQEP